MLSAKAGTPDLTPLATSKTTSKATLNATPAIIIIGILIGALFIIIGHISKHHSALNQIVLTAANDISLTRDFLDIAKTGISQASLQNSMCMKQSIQEAEQNLQAAESYYPELVKARKEAQSIKLFETLHKVIATKCQISALIAAQAYRATYPKEISAVVLSGTKAPCTSIISQLTSYLNSPAVKQIAEYMQKHIMLQAQLELAKLPEETANLAWSSLNEALRTISLSEKLNILAEMYQAKGDLKQSIVCMQQRMEASASTASHLNAVQNIISHSFLKKQTLFLRHCCPKNISQPAIAI